MEKSLLKIIYLRLDELLPWDKNPKRHQFDELERLIVRYGFRDPPGWDSSLNGGSGGIVEGNGRFQVLQSMKQRKADRPRGIDEADDGEWLVPIVMGINASSEQEAIAYAIDHNNSVLSGAGFTIEQNAQIWEPEGYLELLDRFNGADDVPPETISTAQVQELFDLAANSVLPEDNIEIDEDDPKPGKINKCPSCGHEW